MPYSSMFMTLSQLESIGMDFQSYLNFTKRIVQKEWVSEVYEPEKMLRYTAANLERMEYVLQNLQINKKLYNKLQEPSASGVWMVISEPWCGDAAQIVPVLYLVSCCNPDIEFRLVLRDSHPEIMDQYLTDGNRSIPILVCYDPISGEEKWKWGPRPEALQQMLLTHQASAEETFGSMVRKLHAWYREDLGKHIQEELIDTINKYGKENL